MHVRGNVKIKKAVGFCERIFYIFFIIILFSKNIYISQTTNKYVIESYRENIELEVKTKSIHNKIARNHRQIVKHFFPYLLSIYKKWRPVLEEKAMVIDFQSHHCFEVTIKKINGCMVRAQEGQKDV